MTILDTHRSDLARLLQQEATLLKDRSRHDAAAASARSKKDGKLRDAQRSKSASSINSYIRAAEGYEKTEISEAKKSADIAKKLATNADAQRRKRALIASAEQQEQRKRDSNEKSRRRSEIDHARAVAVAGAQIVRHVVVREPEEEKLRVLYLTTNPEPGGDWLRTDAEIRAVKNIVRGALHRDQIVVEHKSAATPEDLLDGINDLRPHVVHFSGHGGAGSLLFDNGSAETPDGREMSFSLLARLLNATSTPPTLLVLNACDTLDGADELVNVVPVVIAMSDSVDDAAATVFAGKFYGAIASAQPVSKALEQGKVGMELAGFVDDAMLPTMVHRDDVNVDTLVLVKGAV